VKRFAPSSLWFSLFLAIVAAIGWWSWRQVDPPSLPAHPLRHDQFSPLRARRHVEIIAQEPRPIGSAENSRVREYIVRELRSLGLSASVKRLTAFRRDGAIRSGGVVNNIVARIQGTATTKAVLLSCHYDSVVEGPGASDDAHAIAALLESARALLNGPHYATTSSCCSPMAKSR